MNVLVVAAHPDDEVLGAGGTIARLSREGASVSILILGEGATSRDDVHSETSVERLVDQARAAAAVLGAKDVRLAGFPDNRFDSVDLLDLVKKVEESVYEIYPEVVLTQHGGDVNIDHQRAFQAVLAATRPQPSSSIRSVLSFEVASSTEWAFQQTEPRFRPSVFYDIGADLETKIEALRCYSGELRDWPHPRSVEGVRALAQYRGTTIGTHAAEAFTVIRERR